MRIGVQICSEFNGFFSFFVVGNFISSRFFDFFNNIKKLFEQFRGHILEFLEIFLGKY